MSNADDYNSALCFNDAPPCVCCDHQMTTLDEFCDECQTPAEITRSVSQRKAQPHFISVVGPSNAGKTVFLGLLLDMLCGGAKNLKGVPNGAFRSAFKNR